VLAFAQQRNNFYSNELNEVVISDSKFALKSRKGNCKITSEELSKKSGQSLAAILSTVAGLEINGNQSSGKTLQDYRGFLVVLS
jgi:vitamin B12 transporter